MSQGVLCGFCYSQMSDSEDKGKLEPLKNDDVCNHQFHYLCMVSSLCSGSVKGQSNCPFCNQIFRRVLPVQNEEPSPQNIERTFIIETSPAVSSQLESTTILTPIVTTDLTTSPIATSSTVFLQDLSFSIETPSCSSSPGSPTSPTKKPREKKMKRCIFRDEATKKLPTPPKLKVFGKPYALTCGFCQSIHKNRMAKSRCAEKHLGPFPCPLCGITPFNLHSSMRLHHKAVHGVKWTSGAKGK